jgi:hypothetical protein
VQGAVVVDVPGLPGDHHGSPSGAWPAGTGSAGATHRHPDDPEPVPASKARAVWWLGLLAVLTGPLVGGLVPASLALALAGQFRRDAHPAGGFLTGAAKVRRGERMAVAGIVLAAAALVAAAVIGLVRLAHGPPGIDFPPTVD